MSDACPFAGVLVCGLAIQLVGVELQQVTHQQYACCHGQLLLELLLKYTLHHLEPMQYVSSVDLHELL